MNVRANRIGLTKASTGGTGTFQLTRPRRLDRWLVALLGHSLAYLVTRLVGGLMAESIVCLGKKSSGRRPFKRLLECWSGPRRAQKQ